MYWAGEQLGHDFYTDTWQWAQDHPWEAIGVGAAVLSVGVGAGLCYYNNLKDISGGFDLYDSQTGNIDYSSSINFHYSWENSANQWNVGWTNTASLFESSIWGIDFETGFEVDLGWNSAGNWPDPSEYSLQ